MSLPAPSLTLAVTLALLARGLDAQGPAPLVYTTTANGVPIVAETVQCTETGWSSDIQLDLPGQKTRFRIVLDRKEGEPPTWTVEVAAAKGAPTVIRAKLNGTAVAVDIQPHDIQRTFQVQGAEPFFYEPLVWAPFIEVGRELVPRLIAGTLELPAHRTAVMAQHTRSVRLDIEQAERLEGGYWRVDASMVGGSDILLTFDDAGCPARIEVPSDNLIVTRADVESAALDIGRTVVDRGPWRALLSHDNYEVQPLRTVRVPLRDEVHLATDLLLPEGEGPFPTILIRTPYSRTAMLTFNGQRFARRGYAVVVQSVRGRFESEGIFRPLHQETADGKDVLDWLVQQSWCDGNIGMLGGSYAGVVQWYAAASAHPALKAIIPQVSPPDPHENFPYEGGALQLAIGWWAKLLQAQDDQGEAGAPGEVAWAELLQTLPLGRMDDALGVSQPFFDEWLAHPPSDRAYWQPACYQHRMSDMRVAVLNVTGWYDGDQPGALQNFPRMQQARDQDTRSAQYLVVGPWGHLFNQQRRLGDVDFGPEAVIDMQALELRFFDRYLKGTANGIEDEDPVWVFVMGENRWRRAASWPLPQTRLTPLYLGSDGHATTWEGDGQLGLVLGKVGSQAADSLRYDPAVSSALASKTLEAAFIAMDESAATMDVRKLGDDASVLDYTSPPLAAPVELTGPIQVHLWGSTTSADADWVASLLVVEKSGALRQLALGIQRVRYRDGTDRPVPAGEVAKVTIDCWATGIRLQAGERLRLTLSGTAYPGYARNLGTLEPLLTATEMVASTQTVLHDAEHPTHILLPVVPRADAPKLVFESAD